MRKLLWLVLAGMLFSPSAWALSLDEARQQGRVGETLSGYIAPVQQDSTTLALVARINQGREQQYQQLAQRNGMSTAQVARIAGEKLVQRAEAGEYVRGINGLWLQKK
ncbi:YdbL family protein [Winslowiella iniecta]|uniref:Amine metabolic protein ydbL n=1 Tax=Winslowiella iniecta TaxID=1560201 RepID=A0A0L7T4G5_9GAMM|nr:YdbL family protein [Winslowiella iniecta]KOC90245.1 amine metabolic protein ydbL [Winslowiella iniecta]KOC94793.1 amine metabolic protein ydbL [Winslowiella iniecta]